MILVCDSCSASLQFDEKKVPAGKFTVRCPKCKNIVRVNVGASENGNHNSAANKGWQPPPQTAAAYKSAKGAETRAESGNASPENVMQLLANLLQQGGGKLTGNNSLNGANQRVLLCLPIEHSELAAQLLSEAGWEAFVAETPVQAIETLNETKMENVVFSQNFAPEQKGAMMLQNYFNQLTAIRRRQFFLISLENLSQTHSMQEAFLRDLDLIVNVKDLPNLPLILKRARREFDDAYRHFKAALAGI